MGPEDNFINSSWCSSLKSINSSYLFSRLCSYVEISAWNFLSKQFSEYRCSELMLSTSFWMGPDENFLNSSWCFAYNHFLIGGCSKLWYWSYVEIWALNFLWNYSDENMFDFLIRSYIICVRLSSCLSNFLSAVSHENVSSLDDGSIIILFCFSWYVSLKFWIYSFLLLTSLTPFLFKHRQFVR